MDTTASLLDRLAAKYGGASDYRLAKILGIQDSAISNYRHGRSCLGDEVAVKVAAELGEPAAYVLACMMAERARTPTIRKIWADLARAMRKQAAAAVAAASVAGLLFVASPGPAEARERSGLNAAGQSIHYALSRRRGRRRRLRQTPMRRPRRRADSLSL